MAENILSAVDLVTGIVRNILNGRQACNSMSFHVGIGSQTVCTLVAFLIGTVVEGFCPVLFNRGTSKAGP